MSSLSSAIPQQTISTSLNETFTPAYVQASTESILDSTYDWLDGKQPNVTFDINTTAQKEAFTGNLAALLEPQIAALPQCKSLSEFNAAQPTCTPPGTNATDLAKLVATDATNQASIFTQPITDASVAQAATDNQAASPIPSSNTATQQLPSITANLRLWLVLLPIIAVASGAGTILLAHHHKRLKAAKNLAGRMAAGLTITAVIGIIVAIFGPNIAIGSLVSGNNVISQIVDPVLRVALPDIGSRLAWVSGLLAALAFAAWLTIRIIKKRRDIAELRKPAEDIPAPIEHKPEKPQDQDTALHKSDQ